MSTILITGGAGFIGSSLVRHMLQFNDCEIVVVDKLTYAGNLASLSDCAGHDRFCFEQLDICEPASLKPLFDRYKPAAVMHLAAESHVDRSIDGPGEFIQTNINGTYNLLQASLDYWRDLHEREKMEFRFLHVSTDEVFGSLSPDSPAFSELTPYDPHSPYSASKAASDHLVRAWHDTYGLPILITNCSNNYGPYQFPEKLIPVVILKCLNRESIPVYGKGANIRDWLYVDDHCSALRTVLETGRVGETYVVGGNNERRNIDLVEDICLIMDELLPLEEGKKYRELITFVTDRPGHDMRYAIDATKIRHELGWEPIESNATGMRKTVQWYLENRDWWEKILSGDYKFVRLGHG